jgi:hypothetical protein
MSSWSLNEHEVIMKLISSINKDKSRHKNADIQSFQCFYMKNNLCKSETDVLNNNEIKTNI